MSLMELRGMTQQLATALAAQGVKTEEQLLAAGKTPQGRKEMAKAADVKDGVILELVNRADLARVKGIGEVYANLLEEAGVDTVKELANRVSENLHAKILEVGEKGKLATRMPSVEDVAEWVGQAKKLPRAVEY